MSHLLWFKSNSCGHSETLGGQSETLEVHGIPQWSMGDSRGHLGQWEILAVLVAVLQRTRGSTRDRRGQWNSLAINGRHWGSFGDPWDPGKTFAFILLSHLITPQIKRHEEEDRQIRTGRSEQEDRTGRTRNVFAEQ